MWRRMLLPGGIFPRTMKQVFCFLKRWSETRSCVRKKSEYEVFPWCFHFLHRISHTLYRSIHEVHNTAGAVFLSLIFCDLFHQPAIFPGWMCDHFSFCEARCDHFPHQALCQAIILRFWELYFPTVCHWTAICRKLTQWKATQSWHTRLWLLDNMAHSRLNLKSAPETPVLSEITQISGTFSSSVECFQPNFPRSPWCFLKKREWRPVLAAKSSKE